MVLDDMRVAPKFVVVEPCDYLMLEVLPVRDEEVKGLQARFLC